MTWKNIYIVLVTDLILKTLIVFTIKSSSKTKWTKNDDLQSLLTPENVI